VGIPTDPGYKLYADDCFCWAAGETPKKLFAAVSGIVPGMLWSPGLPKAPNGNWVLEWQSVSVWVGGNDAWILSVDINATRVLFTINGVSGPGAFIYYNFSNPCIADYVNLMGEMAAFTGGRCSIMTRPSE